jgi:hypothetical protein
MEMQVYRSGGIDLWLIGRIWNLVEVLGRYSKNRSTLERLQSLLGVKESTPAEEPVRRSRQIQRRLTAEQQAEVIDRYLGGERAYQLAQAFEVHRTTVARLLADNGVRRPRSLTKHEIAESIKLYRRGWSCQRIGEKFGRDDGTIWLALKKAGVQLRRPWTHLHRARSL